MTDVESVPCQEAEVAPTEVMEGAMTQNPEVTNQVDLALDKEEVGPEIKIDNKKEFPALEIKEHVDLFEIKVPLPALKKAGADTEQPKQAEEPTAAVIESASIADKKMTKKQTEAKKRKALEKINHDMKVEVFESSLKRAIEGQWSKKEVLAKLKKWSVKNSLSVKALQNGDIGVMGKLWCAPNTLQGVISAYRRQKVQYYIYWVDGEMKYTPNKAYYYQEVRKIYKKNTTQKKVVAKPVVIKPAKPNMNVSLMDKVIDTYNKSPCDLDAVLALLMKFNGFMRKEVQGDKIILRFKGYLDWNESELVKTPKRSYVKKVHNFGKFEVVFGDKAHYVVEECERPAAVKTAINKNYPQYFVDEDGLVRGKATKKSCQGYVDFSTIEDWEVVDTDDGVLRYGKAPRFRPAKKQVKKTRKVYTDLSDHYQQQAKMVLKRAKRARDAGYMNTFYKLKDKAMVLLETLKNGFNKEVSLGDFRTQIKTPKIAVASKYNKPRSSEIVPPQKECLEPLGANNTYTTCKLLTMPKTFKVRGKVSSLNWSNEGGINYDSTDEQVVCKDQYRIPNAGKFREDGNQYAAKHGIKPCGITYCDPQRLKPRRSQHICHISKKIEDCPADKCLCTKPWEVCFKKWSGKREIETFTSTYYKIQKKQQLKKQRKNEEQTKLELNPKLKISNMKQGFDRFIKHIDKLREAKFVTKSSYIMPIDGVNAQVVMRIRKKDKVIKQIRYYLACLEDVQTKKLVWLMSKHAWKKVNYKQGTPDYVQHINEDLIALSDIPLNDELLKQIIDNDSLVPNFDLGFIQNTIEPGTSGMLFKAQGVTLNAAPCVINDTAYYMVGYGTEHNGKWQLMYNSLLPEDKNKWTRKFLIPFSSGDDDWEGPFNLRYDEETASVYVEGMYRVMHTISDEFGRQLIDEGYHQYCDVYLKGAFCSLTQELTALTRESRVSLRLSDKRLLHVVHHNGKVYYEDCATVETDIVLPSGTPIINSQGGLVSVITGCVFEKSRFTYNLVNLSGLNGSFEGKLVKKNKTAMYSWGSRQCDTKEMLKELIKQKDEFGTGVVLWKKLDKNAQFSFVIDGRVFGVQHFKIRATEILHSAAGQKKSFEKIQQAVRKQEKKLVESEVRTTKVAAEMQSLSSQMQTLAKIAEDAKTANRQALAIKTNTRPQKQRLKKKKPDQGIVSQVFSAASGSGYKQNSIESTIFGFIFAGLVLLSSFISAVPSAKPTTERIVETQTKTPETKGEHKQVWFETGDCARVHEIPITCNNLGKLMTLQEYKDQVYEYGEKLLSYRYQSDQDRCDFIRRSVVVYMGAFVKTGFNNSETMLQQLRKVTKETEQCQYYLACVSEYLKAARLLYKISGNKEYLEGKDITMLTCRNKLQEIMLDKRNAMVNKKETEIKVNQESTNCEVDPEWQIKSHLSNGAGKSCVEGLIHNFTETSCWHASVGKCVTNADGCALFHCNTRVTDGKAEIGLLDKNQPCCSLGCFSNDDLFRSFIRQPLCTNCFLNYVPFFWHKDCEFLEIPKSKSIWTLTIYKSYTQLKVAEKIYKCNNKYDFNMCCNGNGPAIDFRKEDFKTNHCACSLTTKSTLEKILYKLDISLLQFFCVKNMFTILLSVIMFLIAPKTTITVLMCLLISNMTAVEAACTVDQLVPAAHRTQGGNTTRVNVLVKPGQCINFGEYTLEINKIESVHTYSFVKTIPYSITMKCQYYNYGCPGGISSSVYDLESDCYKKCTGGFTHLVKGEFPSYYGDKCAAYNMVYVRLDACFDIGKPNELVKIYQKVTGLPGIRIQGTMHHDNEQRHVTLDTTYRSMDDNIQIDSIYTSGRSWPANVIEYNNKYFCTNHEIDVSKLCFSGDFFDPYNIDSRCLGVEVIFNKEKYAYEMTWRDADFADTMHNYVSNCPENGLVNSTGLSAVYYERIDLANLDLEAPIIGLGSPENQCATSADWRFEVTPGVEGYHQATVLTVANKGTLCAIVLELEGCYSTDGNVLHLGKNDGKKSIIFWCASNSTGILNYWTRSGKETQKVVVNKNFYYHANYLQNKASQMLEVAQGQGLTSSISSFFTNFDVSNLWQYVSMLLKLSWFKIIVCIIGLWLTYISFINGNILFSVVISFMVYVIVFSGVVAWQSEQQQISYVENIVCFVMVALLLDTLIFQKTLNVNVQLEKVVNWALNKCVYIIYWCKYVSFAIQAVHLVKMINRIVTALIIITFINCLNNLGFVTDLKLLCLFGLVVGYYKISQFNTHTLGSPAINNNVIVIAPGTQEILKRIGFGFNDCNRNVEERLNKMQENNTLGSFVKCNDNNVELASVCGFEGLENGVYVVTYNNSRYTLVVVGVHQTAYITNHQLGLGTGVAKLGSNNEYEFDGVHRVKVEVGNSGCPEIEQGQLKILEGYQKAKDSEVITAVFKDTFDYLGSIQMLPSGDSRYQLNKLSVQARIVITTPCLDNGVFSYREGMFFNYGTMHAKADCENFYATDNFDLRKFMLSPQKVQEITRLKYHPTVFKYKNTGTTGTRYAEHVDIKIENTICYHKFKKIGQLDSDIWPVHLRQEGINYACDIAFKDNSKGQWCFDYTKNYIRLKVDEEYVRYYITGKIFQWEPSHHGEVRLQVSPYFITHENLDAGLVLVDDDDVETKVSCLTRKAYIDGKYLYVISTGGQNNVVLKGSSLEYTTSKTDIAPRANGAVYYTTQFVYDKIFGHYRKIDVLDGAGYVIASFQDTYTDLINPEMHYILNPMIETTRGCKIVQCGASIDFEAQNQIYRFVRESSKCYVWWDGNNIVYKGDLSIVYTFAPVLGDDVSRAIRYVEGKVRYYNQYLVKPIEQWKWSSKSPPELQYNQLITVDLASLAKHNTIMYSGGVNETYWIEDDTRYNMTNYLWPNHVDSDGILVAADLRCSNDYIEDLYEGSRDISTVGVFQCGEMKYYKVAGTVVNKWKLAGNQYLISNSSYIQTTDELYSGCPIFEISWWGGRALVSCITRRGEIDGKYIYLIARMCDTKVILQVNNDAIVEPPLMNYNPRYLQPKEVASIATEDHVLLYLNKNSLALFQNKSDYIGIQWQNRTTKVSINEYCNLSWFEVNDRQSLIVHCVSADVGDINWASSGVVEELDETFHFKRTFRTINKEEKLKVGEVYEFTIDPWTELKMALLVTKETYKSKPSLENLVSALKKVDVKNRNIYIPRIGCGKDKLEWEEVSPLVLKHFEKAKSITVIEIPTLRDSMFKGVRQRLKALENKTKNGTIMFWMIGREDKFPSAETMFGLRELRETLGDLGIDDRLEDVQWLVNKLNAFDTVTLARTNLNSWNKLREEDMYEHSRMVQFFNSNLLPPAYARLYMYRQKTQTFNDRTIEEHEVEAALTVGDFKLPQRVEITTTDKIKLWSGDVHLQVPANMILRRAGPPGKLHTSWCYYNYMRPALCKAVVGLYKLRVQVEFNDESDLEYLIDRNSHECYMDLTINPRLADPNAVICGFLKWLYDCNVFEVTLSIDNDALEWFLKHPLMAFRTYDYVACNMIVILNINYDEELMEYKNHCAFETAWYYLLESPNTDWSKNTLCDYTIDTSQAQNSYELWRAVVEQQQAVGLSCYSQPQPIQHLEQITNDYLYICNVISITKFGSAFIDGGKLISSNHCINNNNVAVYTNEFSAEFVPKISDTKKDIYVGVPIDAKIEVKLSEIFKHAQPDEIVIAWNPGNGWGQYFLVHSKWYDEIRQTNMQTLIPISIDYATGAIRVQQNASFPGMSGSPIINHKGEIVGVYGLTKDVQYNGGVNDSAQIATTTVSDVNVAAFKGAVDHYLDNYEKIRKDNRYAYLVAPTGTGKTTIFTRLMAEKMVNQNKTIVLLQPNVIAVNNTYIRIKDEWSTRKLEDNLMLEKRVGIRNLDSTESWGHGATKLVCMTYGKFMSNCSQSFDIIVMDEIHGRVDDENVLAADVYLEHYCKFFKKGLVKMTADEYMDWSEGYDLLRGVELQTTNFDIAECEIVDITLCRDDPTFVPVLMSGVCANGKVWGVRKKELKSGITIVFLAGIEECKKAASEFKSTNFGSNVDSIAVYAGCGLALNKIKPGTWCFCTNAVQQSVTIPDAANVIDFGKAYQTTVTLSIQEARPKLYYEKTLTLLPISKSDALQRKGRTGRTTQGAYFKLPHMDYADAIKGANKVCPGALLRICNVASFLQLAIRDYSCKQLANNLEMYEWLEPEKFGKSEVNKTFREAADVTRAKENNYKEKLKNCVNVTGDLVYNYLRWTVDYEEISKASDPTFLRTSSSEQNIDWYKQMEKFWFLETEDKFTDYYNNLSSLQKLKSFEEQTLMGKLEKEYEQIGRVALGKVGIDDYKENSAHQLAGSVFGSVAIFICMGAAVNYGLDKYGSRMAVKMRRIPKSQITSDAKFWANKFQKENDPKNCKKFGKEKAHYRQIFENIWYKIKKKIKGAFSSIPEAFRLNTNVNAVVAWFESTKAAAWTQINALLAGTVGLSQAGLAQLAGSGLVGVLYTKMEKFLSKPIAMIIVGILSGIAYSFMSIGGFVLTVATGLLTYFLKELLTESKLEKFVNQNDGSTCIRMVMSTALGAAAAYGIQVLQTQKQAQQSAINFANMVTPVAPMINGGQYGHICIVLHHIYATYSMESNLWDVFTLSCSALVHMYRFNFLGVLTMGGLLMALVGMKLGYQAWLTSELKNNKNPHYDEKVLAALKNYDKVVLGILSTGALLSDPSSAVTVLLAALYNWHVLNMGASAAATDAFLKYSGVNFFMFITVKTVQFLSKPSDMTQQSVSDLFQFIGLGISTVATISFLPEERLNGIKSSVTSILGKMWNFVVQCYNWFKEKICWLLQKLGINIGKGVVQAMKETRVGRFLTAGDNDVTADNEPIGHIVELNAKVGHAMIKMWLESKKLSAIETLFWFSLSPGSCETFGSVSKLKLLGEIVAKHDKKWTAGCTWATNVAYESFCVPYNVIANQVQSRLGVGSLKGGAFVVKQNCYGKDVTIKISNAYDREKQIFCLGGMLDLVVIVRKVGDSTVFTVLGFQVDKAMMELVTEIMTKYSCCFKSSEIVWLEDLDDYTACLVNVKKERTDASIVQWLIGRFLKERLNDAVSLKFDSQMGDIWNTMNAHRPEVVCADYFNYYAVKFGKHYYSGTPIASLDGLEEYYLKDYCIPFGLATDWYQITKESFQLLSWDKTVNAENSIKVISHKTRSITKLIELGGGFSIVKSKLLIKSFVMNVCMILSINENYYVSPYGMGCLCRLYYDFTNKKVFYSVCCQEHILEILSIEHDDAELTNAYDAHYLSNEDKVIYLSALNEMIAEGNKKSKIESVVETVSQGAGAVGSWFSSFKESLMPAQQDRENSSNFFLDLFGIFDDAKYRQNPRDRPTIQNIVKNVQEIYFDDTLPSGPEQEDLFEEEEEQIAEYSNTDFPNFLYGFSKVTIGLGKGWKFHQHVSNTPPDPNEVIRHYHNLNNRGEKMSKVEWDEIKAKQRVVLPHRVRDIGEDKKAIVASRAFVKAQQLYEADPSFFDNCIKWGDPGCGYGGFPQYFGNIYYSGQPRYYYASSLNVPRHRIPNYMNMAVEGSQMMLIDLYQPDATHRNNLANPKFREYFVKCLKETWPEDDDYRLDLVIYDIGEFADNSKKQLEWWNHKGSENVDSLIDGMENFLVDTLKPGGKLLMKFTGYFQGGDSVLYKVLRHFKHFKAIKVGTQGYFSTEFYIFAAGFRPIAVENLLNVRNFYGWIGMHIKIGLSKAENIMLQPENYGVINRQDWLVPRNSEIVHATIAAGTYPPGFKIHLKLPEWEINSSWSPNWEERLDKVFKFIKETSARKMRFSRINKMKADNLTVIGHYSVKDKFGNLKMTANSLIADYDNHVFGIDTCTSTYGHAQATKRFKEESFKKRLDVNPGKLNMIALKQLASVLPHMITEYGQQLLGSCKFLGKQEVEVLLNKKGASYVFSSYQNLRDFMEKHSNWFEIVMDYGVKPLMRGQGTHCFFSIMHKNEPKARKDVENGRLKYKKGVDRKTLEEGAYLPHRYIQFADEISRIAHYIILGDLITKACNNKIYKGTINGIPPFNQGNVLRAAWDLVSDEEFKVAEYGDNPHLDLFIEKCKDSFDRGKPTGISLDFSGWDGTVTAEERFLEAEFIKKFYPPELHHVIHRCLEEMSFAICVNHDGSMWLRSGQRGSGELVTSFGNTLLVACNIFRSVGNILNIQPKDLLETQAKVYYKVAGKVKTLELTRIPQFSDGDDTVIITKREYANTLMQHLSQSVAECNKLLRSGRESGAKKVQNFSELNFCSHTYEPIFFGNVGEVGASQMSLSEKQLIGLAKASNNKIRYMPCKPVADILSRLRLTLKTNTIKYDPTDLGPEGCVAVTRGKIVSYLLLYGHFRLVRMACLSLLMVVGDGPHSMTKFIARYPGQINIKTDTTMGAVKSVHSIDTLDNFGYRQYQPERNELMDLRYNAQLGGYEIPKTFSGLLHSSVKWVIRRGYTDLTPLKWDRKFTKQFSRHAREIEDTDHVALIKALVL
uniref:Genome polyprotein n=1 Tax=Locusta migratoria associated flavi-like virus TaxID=3142496 RepID=A0AAT9JNV8_9FLAV